MQSSLKKSVTLGLAALSLAGVATIAETTSASAKSYATAGAYTTLKTDATARNVASTGTNALYTKPGTVKGAKVVASKATMKKLANSNKSASYFRAYGQKTTNRGSVYYRVVSMDGKYRGYIYGGTTAGTFAGGIKTASTTTAATTPTTKTYYLKSPGTANTLWSAPKYTQYKATKVINSTSALATDAFTVDSAATKTKEGSLYYHVTDNNNAKISGWIYAGALQTGENSAITSAKSVTVNYVDSSTGKSVKSGVLITASDAKSGTALGTDDAATVNTAIGSATYLPAGYSLTSATNTYVTSTDTWGSSVTVPVTANAAAGITITSSSALSSTTGANDKLTTTDALAADASTTVATAQSNFTKDYTGVSGTTASQSDLSAALTSDKLNTIYVPVYESDGTTQSTNSAGAKLYTKYTLNTASLPTGITFGSTSLALTYNAAGSYALTSGSSTMTAQ
ncbi:S-layer protein [Levilactobacillus wangkuiensis]|uniref:S-layer protein n=1 Tax=Levilactobacillus wangkuiensis TaxID=2799566 RepID=UPI0019406AA2|nr:S-layer protein [Levilactobacillus wangkuiensis]